MPDTVDELVRLRSVQDADKPMVIDPDCRLSYRELEISTLDLAAGFVHAGVGKGTRVGLIMPNGVRWVQIAIALTRIGAVLVPLSTLLPARELVAQLRTASVQFLVSVEEFRGHRYLDDLASALGRRDLSETLHSRNFPRYGRCGRPMNYRRLLISSGRCRRGHGYTERPHGDHVHVRQQRPTQRRGALPRQCAGRRPIRFGKPLHRFRDPAVPADALLLGGRLRQRRAVRAGGRRDTDHREDPAAGNDAATPGARTGDVVSRLARSGRGVGATPHRAQADLSALRPGSLEALLPAELRSQPGSRATLFGMTEAFGPYAATPPTPTCRPRRGAAAAGRSQAWRSASQIPRVDGPSPREPLG